MNSAREHRRAVLLPVLCAAVAACGTLETPDVQHGAVTGRIPNASAGAHAYVLGSPQLLATPAVDGSFRLDGVPAGAITVVLYDGSVGAESIPVTVEGASIAQVDPGRPLKPAAVLVAGMSPLAGTRATGLSFTVGGTPLQQVEAEAGAVRLFPLPAGAFTVTARQPGFEDRQVDLVLAQGGSASLEVDLPVDVRAERRGCLSCGCDHGLACASDGRCYECVQDADCGPSGTCTAAHVCSRPAGAGSRCDACTVASDCVGANAACVNPTGGTLTGSCTSSCSGTEACPSGYDCSGGVCAVMSSCVTLTATYGSTCTEDRNCQAALKDGKCVPLNRPSGTPGYCSGRVQAGCPVGFGPDPQGSGYCTRSP